jgi:hypothetical protein
MPPDRPAGTMARPGRTVVSAPTGKGGGSLLPRIMPDRSENRETGSDTT